MNLLFGAAGSLPIETGLKIAANGQITFASGLAAGRAQCGVLKRRVMGG
jgi:hypothetical protein